ncbi:MAG: hypothetical protein C0516_15330 [Gemmatimonas sp.]|nr:hypothetical protein [Gemmatimonas sp.]
MIGFFTMLVFLGLAVDLTVGILLAVYARATNMSAKGGLLVVACSLVGLYALAQPIGVARSVALGFVTTAIPLGLIVHTYSWRDAVGSGRYRELRSLRSLVQRRRDA